MGGQNRCPNCGAFISKGAKFCINCNEINSENNTGDSLMKKQEKNSHVIIINKKTEVQIKDLSNFIEGGAFDSQNQEVIEDLENSIPEISAFLKYYNFKKHYNNQIKKTSYKIFLVHEHENNQLKELSEVLLKQLGFNCKSISLSGSQIPLNEYGSKINYFKDTILQLYDDINDVYFNITSSSNELCQNILEINRDFGGKIYLLTNRKKLLFLPHYKQKTNDEIGNFDKVLLDSLKFTDLQEKGDIKYEVVPEMIRKTLQNSKTIKNEYIIIERGRKEFEKTSTLDIIRMVKITGLRLSTDENHTNDDYFFHRIFEGLSYSENKIFRILVNNKKGINIYVGIIQSATTLDEGKQLIEEKLELFIKLMKSIFPGLEFQSATKDELERIEKFIENQQYNGSIIGFPGPVSNRVLKRLENSLSMDKWGIMSIARSLTQDDINDIMKSLNEELNSILRELPIDLEEIRNRHEKIQDQNDRKEFMQFLNIKYTRVQLIIKLDNIRKFFKNKQTIGLWDTCTYFFADSKSTYRAIYSILKSHYKNVDSFWFKTRFLQLDEFLSECPKSFQMISVKQREPVISSHFKPFHTIYSSHALGSFIFIPMTSLMNYSKSKIPNFQNLFPDQLRDTIDRPIKIGTIKNPLKEEDFYIDMDSLVRHCLVMGSTGSGKTNTIFNLLLNIQKEEKQFPFLIIDPAKKEYRHLRNFIPDLKVYTAGQSINPLEINIFEVPEFLTYSQWINELIEIIDTSFYMHMPFREILYTALVNMYRLNGWTEHSRGLTPNLREFIQFAKLKIDCMDYKAETRGEFKGVLSARFETLLRGTRRNTFNVYASHPTIEEILQTPIVIELQGLRNDNEKSLIFNILIRKLYLYLQERGFSSSLKHITVIEEAHRLLSHERRTYSSSTNSVKMKAQEHFGDILAEIRTYGEALVIVEQKPNELMNSMITNTNLKICHKLPSSRQIALFKDSLGLLPEHIPFIAKLSPGECILKLEKIEMPFLIHATLVKERNWGIENGYTDEKIRENSSITRELKDINFKIDGNNKEFILELYELVYTEGEEEVEQILNNPKRDDLVNFSNYQQVLWEKLQWFFDNFNFCPSCEYCKPTSQNDRCSKCNAVLKKIETLHFPLLNLGIERTQITRRIELNDLLEKYIKLAPSSYSNSSQRSLLSIKNSYRKLMEPLEPPKSSFKNLFG
jgi:DNA helicase HerA-like ATPase